MDLWIRSQNKEVLVKCNCLALEEQTKGKYSILNYSGLEFYQFLGTYEYEKALEVLDEIINLMLPTKAGFDENGEYSCKGCFANKDMMYYEMPEE